MSVFGNSSAGISTRIGLLEELKPWAGVLEEYLSENSPMNVEQTCKDIRDWLDERPPLSKRLPDDFGCDFDPSADGMTEREWLEAMARYLESALARMQN